MSAVIVKIYFYDNCRDSRALIGKFTLSISGQPNEFVVSQHRHAALEDFLTLSFDFLLFIIVFFFIKKKQTKQRKADINGKEKK